MGTTRSRAESEEESGAREEEGGHEEKGEEREKRCVFKVPVQEVFHRIHSLHKFISAGVTPKSRNLDALPLPRILPPNSALLSSGAESVQSFFTDGRLGCTM
jgi:hypothetical protein